MDKESSRVQVLTELRSEQEAVLSFGDALDAKLNMLIGSGSLILGLFSTLGMIQYGPLWYWGVIIIAGVAYFCLSFRLGSALAPASYHFPLPESWENLYKIYVPLEGEALFDKLISQNIEAIERNKAVNARKARAVTFGIWALPAILVILTGCRLILAMISPATPPLPY